LPRQADDDANAAGNTDTLTLNEVEVIKALLDDADCDSADVARFCKTNNHRRLNNEIGD